MSSPRLRAALSSVWPPAAAVAALLLVWEGAVRVFGIPPYLLPSPIAVFASLGTDADVYLRHASVSTIEALAGFAIGMSAGFLLALVLDRSRVLERGLLPLLIMATNIPIVAFAPVVVIYLGFGIESKIAVAAFLTFFPVVIYTLRGLQSANSMHRDLFYVLASNWRQTTFRLKLPSALPYIFSALRVGAPAAVLAAVVAEFIQATQGLGWLILTSAYANNMTRLWATVIVCSTIAVTFYTVVVVVERLVTPWNTNQSSKAV
ncbi:MAG: ABC transporter permease [Actinomycetota bacterium]|nr:ABC transporter permease [Actinomycetota bacterium]